MNLISRVSSVTQVTIWTFVLNYKTLKADNDARALSFLDSLDHKSGPMYQMECLPYFTILNLGMKKSEFRRL